VGRPGALALSVALLISATTWLFGAARPGANPGIDFPAHPIADLVVTDQARADAFARAAVRLHTPRALAPVPAVIECEFMADDLSGTTPKFHCVLPGGEVIKVKYGRNPEIQAEAAGTALLTRLGYATDTVTIAGRVRCYGCPRFPWAAARLRTWPLASRLLPERYEGGYSDFEAVAVERKFPAPAIETATAKGWAWWETDRSHASRADLDAFRLLAVFLAHWDNKRENQRLVCLDSAVGGSTEQDPPYCEQPLLMIQDLGAVFGPYKVNLFAWRDAPIWANAPECVATMRTLPFLGSTFEAVPISEEGRRQLLDQLEALTDADIRGVFIAGAFGDYHSGTDDERDLRAWTAAFRHRVQAISAAGPCPATSPSRPSHGSSSPS
jgi:hypothetical protein